MRAVVVGGGIAGLVAARELVLAGHDVTVRESEEVLGGMVRGVDLAGLRIDSGAEAYATRSPEVADLCADLGLDVAEPAGRSHVWWPGRGAFPLARGVLGVPGGLDDPACSVLTDDELARAALDHTEPVGDLGHTVADVVTARMGPAVVRRLVEPLTRGVYGMGPDDMDLERFAPGLLDDVRTHRSLMRAVGARSAGGAAVAQPVGGMHRLVDALTAWLRDAGARLETLARVAHLDEVDADRLVLATPARVTARLLRSRGVTFTPPRTSVTRSLLLALRHPGLREDPVGSGLLLGERPAGMVPRALTHYSAKWPWARADDVDVIRVALPPEVEPELDQVLADVSTLVGLDLDLSHLVDHHQARWNEVPKVLVGPERQRLDEAVAALADITLTGAWLAGNGLTAVVASAKEAAR